MTDATAGSPKIGDCRPRVAEPLRMAPGFRDEPVGTRSILQPQVVGMPDKFQSVPPRLMLNRKGRGYSDGQLPKA